MQFQYRYHSQTGIQHSASSTGLSFAPDTFRKPTFFKGKLNKHIPFREAMSALHHIVVSDLRYQPKDRTQYLEWLKQQETIWLAEASAQSAQIKTRIEEIQEKLNKVRTEKHKVMGPFWKARREFRTWVWKNDPAISFVLDPVITVHPDELFFECFSQDESSYGKLSCNYNVFKEIGEFARGTTNIDYSRALYNEFQKIRNYKETSFEIDPGGFEVQTEMEDAFHEKKIDLPDSWVRGFLQVSTAMTRPAVVLNFRPVDIQNIIFFLKRNKAKKSPRSIRFLLEPGKPVVALMEPWNKKLVFRNTIYKGKEATEIRLWGRRRLLLLERMLPVARNVRVTLLGTGLPSFFEADLGDMTFTLGLSGWTANDWTRTGSFDLMAPRRDVDALSRQRVFEALQKNWRASVSDLSNQTGLSVPNVESALLHYIQGGRVVYDLNTQQYRIRELTKEELPLEQLRFSNPEEEKAWEICRGGQVEFTEELITPEGNRLTGRVKHNGQVFPVQIVTDADDRMRDGRCTCNYFKANKMLKGPCAHMIALRQAHYKKHSTLMKSN